MLTKSQPVQALGVPNTPNQIFRDAIESRTLTLDRQIRFLVAERDALHSLTEYDLPRAITIGLAHIARQRRSQFFKD